MSHDNPYRPGAGQSPPFLAGRQDEIGQFSDLLNQQVIISNALLTGLRGIGKTVLMDEKFKPEALDRGWIWIGTDFSEAAFVNEDKFCERLLTDLSVFTRSLTISTEKIPFGFDQQAESESIPLTYRFLERVFNQEPGLASDKLKATLEFVWHTVEDTMGLSGIIFAYDEAHVVRDQPQKDQYPLALLLDTFQSLQRREFPFMLVLSGLPLLFPRLVESRTFAERMFHVIEIDRLDTTSAREAIETPLLAESVSESRFTEIHVEGIIAASGRYPYFLQFICQKAFEYLTTTAHTPEAKVAADIPLDSIVRELDFHFFAGRWSTLPDRQRELLFCIACCGTVDNEFSIGSVVDASKRLLEFIAKPFRSGDISQALRRLTDAGFVYRNRHGRYSLAIPLLDRFVKRQFASVLDVNLAEIDRIERSHSITQASVQTSDYGTKDVLVVVDLQNDFFSGGALTIPEAKSLVAPLNRVIRWSVDRGMTVVFTQDWHPFDHQSFDHNGGVWPPHCVMNTPGADIPSTVDRPPNAVYIRFGTDAASLGYSPFENVDMRRVLDDGSVAAVYIVGIALEYCVLATCIDAVEFGKRVIAVEPLICQASLDGGAAEHVWKLLEDLGVVRLRNVTDLPDWSTQ